MANYYVDHFNCGVVVDKPTEKERAMFSRVWEAMNKDNLVFEHRLRFLFTTLEQILLSVDIKRKEPLSYSRPRHYKKNYYTIKNPLSLSECN